jgi:glycosyltransferase involved in cell wall biosynthesis
MIIISVIIPMYNVGPYVERCIRSLENQDIMQDEIEVICVNDGSSDNGREVVLRLQKEFINIILIDQENQGVSMARNNGADKATGKYLLFIDPDDFVQEYSLRRILEDADSKRIQMVIPGYTFIDLDGNIQGYKIFDKYEPGILTGIEAYYFSREKSQAVVDSSVGIIFETDFLNKYDLRYPPDVILNQDAELLARAHCLAERCIIVKHLLYIAVARPNSATRSNQFTKEKVRNGFILAANNLKIFQQRQSLNEKQKLFLNGPITQFVLLAVYSGIKTRTIKYLIKTVDNLQISDLSNLRLEGCKSYHAICGKAYNFSPYFGALVLALYMKIDRWYDSLSIKRVIPEKR